MRSTFRMITLLILLTALPAGAQYSGIASGPVASVRGVPPDMQAYGTSSPTMLAIPEFSFEPLTSEATWSWNGGRYLTNGGSMLAGVVLPTGVSIHAIELEACDTSGSGFAMLTLLSCVGGTCNALGSVNTGLAETPGCGRFFLLLPAPYTVQNADSRLAFEFLNLTDDGTTRLLAARIAYHREVVPAPATASFADVPVGSPLHRYVEALVGAGITAGCGGGNFCPEAAVTRGQVAVFLAKALGLHWPY